MMQSSVLLVGMLEYISVLSRPEHAVRSCQVATLANRVVRTPETESWPDQGGRRVEDAGHRRGQRAPHSSREELRP